MNLAPTATTRPTLRWVLALAAVFALGSVTAPAAWAQGKKASSKKLKAQKKKEKPPTSYPKAPRVRVAEWVKGEPLNLTAKGGGLVALELWATWCGPCIKAMPHLNELKETHGDKLEIVALSEEEAGVVKPFLEKNPALMNFPVALDKEGKTFETYRKEFGFRGIPVTFLIQDGEVLWHGHPMQMDGPLEAILGGRWTPATQFRTRELRRVANNYRKHMLGKEPITPDVEAMARHIIDNAELGPMVLNNVAWALLTDVEASRRPLAVALEMSQVANRQAGGDSYHIRDTLALALFLSGDVTGAIMHQSRAIELCQASPKANCKSVISAMSRYKQALSGP